MVLAFLDSFRWGQKKRKCVKNTSIAGYIPIKVFSSKVCFSMFHVVRSFKTTGRSAKEQLL